jgi:hypothetical protein
MRPFESKVQVICDFPKPATHRKLQEFLGLVTFINVVFPVVVPY